MCILGFKPAGIDFPSDETLTNCYDANPHGIGLAWRDTDGINHIRKGFMDIKKFLKYIKNRRDYLKTVDCVIHFRFATTGSQIGGNTHPFPISYNVSDLKKCAYDGRMRILAHNGIISSYTSLLSGVGKNPHDISDTMQLCKMLARPDKTSKESVKDAIITGGKFVIQKDNGVFELLGAFVKDKNGVSWSNDSYLGYDKIWVNYGQYMNRFYNYKGRTKTKYTGCYYDEYDDIDPINEIILDSDLDDEGFCTHEKWCKSKHECYLLGTTIPQAHDWSGVKNICPIWQKENISRRARIRSGKKETIQEIDKRLALVKKYNDTDICR